MKMKINYNKDEISMKMPMKKNYSEYEIIMKLRIQKEISYQLCRKCK